MYKYRTLLVAIGVFSFPLLWLDSCAVREFVNKSAASAASPDSVKFQAVIKSAASAASPKAKSREGSSRGAPGDGARWDDGAGRTTDRIRTTARLEISQDPKNPKSSRKGFPPLSLIHI